MRTWNLTIALDSDGGLPLFLQISRAIAEGIRSGRLKPGAPLPSSRALARTLSVNRNTVLAGYDELLAEGWVTTRARVGTFVSHDLPIQAPDGAVGQRHSKRAGYPVEPPIAFDRPLLYRSGMLVLAKGAPDARLLPIAELARAYRRALLRHGRELLWYGDPRGHPRLREALVGMLSTTRGVAATPESILVTRGSQMALHLAARALIRPGDVVAVEALGHPAPWEALRLAGARLVPVPVDEKGLSVDALAEMADRRPIRAILVTPHHQFPTTTVMPAGRRLRLLELARSKRIAVIEDDYDHEFHYEGRSVLPLASTDRAGMVLYVGTLSKILAPGLRMGFAVGPVEVIERMTSLRVATDMQGDHVVERAVAELFEDGELERHVRRMRRAYRSRRDALVDALARHLGGALEFTIPSGGMALWARVAAGIDVDRWARRGVDCGVVFRGGGLYDFGGEPQPFTRLGFTTHDVRELGQAARRMARALRGLGHDGRVREAADRAQSPDRRGDLTGPSARMSAKTARWASRPRT